MKILLAAAACAALPLFAGNLVFNSSFELGEKGWNGFCERQIPETFERKISGKNWGIDSSTAHSGKNSLRVCLKGDARRTAVFSHDIPVEFGKTYTVSFYAKGDKAVRCPVRMRSCMVPPNRNQDGSIIPPTAWGRDVPQVKTSFGMPKGSDEMVLTAQWKRYSFTFSPERDFVAYTFSVDSEYRDCTIWVDDVQIEEGKTLSAYKPASPLEIALYLPDRTVGVGNAKGRAVAVSYDAPRKNSPVTLSLYNLYTDRVEKTQKLSFDLAPGIPQEKPFAFDGLKYGMYTVFHSLQPRITTRAYESSPEKPAAQRSTKLRDGDFSYQSAAYIASVPVPPAPPKKGYRMGPCLHFGGGLQNGLYRDGMGLGDEFAETLRDSGATITKVWNAFPWTLLEPEQGKFNFTHSDSIIPFMSKYHLPGVYILMGASFGDRKNPWSRVRWTLPGWVMDRDIAGPNGVKNHFVTNPRFSPLWRPRQDDWKNFLSAILKRYKGQIDSYEIFNEPQLMMDAKSYFPYLKTAYQTIHQLDPFARVVGISATSDFGVNADSFIAQVIRMGGGRFADLISYHPYLKLDDSVPSQMEQYAGIYKSLRGAGVNKPLANTENYFFENGDSFYFWWNKAPDYDISHYIRHHLIDMGEGLAFSTTVEYDSAFFSSFIHPAQVYHNNSRHGKPQPNLRYVVQAGTSRMVSGAEAVGKIDLPSGALGYTYRKDNALFTVLWNARAKQKSWITLTLPDGVSFTEYDIFSNPMNSRKGTLTLELDSLPRYFRWHNASPERVAAIFRNPRERCENPVRIRNANLLRNGSGAELRMQVENLSGNVLKNPAFTVRGKALKTPVRLTTKEIGYFRTAGLAGKVALSDSCGAEETLEISSEQIKNVPISVPVRRSEKIGYRPRTFVLESVIQGKVESKEDLSAEMEIAMKNISTVRVTVRVRDDKVSRNLHHEPYLRDSVELFVDQDPFGGSGSAYNRFCRQYIAPRSGSQGKIGLRSSFEDRKDGYTWTFEIPVVYRNNFIGLDLTVNDSDGERLKSKLSWSGRSDSFRNRRNFIILELNRGDAAVISAAIRDPGGRILQLVNNESTPFLPTAEWVRHEFRFVPKHDGAGNLVLRSSLGTDRAKDLRFRNISVQGAEGTLPAPDKVMDQAWIALLFRKDVPVTISCELKKDGVQK